MKKLPFIYLLFVPVVVFGFLVGGGQVQAQTNVVDRQQQIANLQSEVLRLQKLLLAKVEPPKLKIFPLDFESVYLIQFNKIIPYGRQSPRAVDQELFNLLLQVLGPKRVTEEIKEWRVFYKEDSGLGAFVETYPKTDKWVFGINRDLYEVGNHSAQKLIAELYIHEYAHILFFEDGEIEEVFSELFWTTADMRHSNRIEGLEDEDLFNGLNSYYENNSSRFVTDYATASVAEDMAETFVSFVLEDLPTDSSVKAQKILFYYDYSEFRNLRQELRNNLKQLSML